jgi:hypothetical protein
MPQCRCNKAKLPDRVKTPSSGNSQLTGASPLPLLDSTSVVHGGTTPATTLTHRTRSRFGEVKDI